MQLDLYSFRKSCSIKNVNKDFHYEDGLKEFDKHRLLVFLYDPETQLKGFIAIHRGGLKAPAFGATRIWKYSSETHALNDVLKLSKLMSYKSALAGLRYGGAKAVLMSSRFTPKKRRELLYSYSEKVNYLSGRFITGADVGISQQDLKNMTKASKHMVGLRSDPVKFTVLGVFYSLQICLKEIFGTKSIRERTFAIQGLGKTGLPILKLLAKEAKKVIVSDVNKTLLMTVARQFPQVEIVLPSEISTQDVDVFMPCALSNAINIRNVAKLRCKIIAGSANSQLENKSIGEILYKLGILYSPDYVINAGGLIAVTDEYENNIYNENRVRRKVARIKKTLSSVIEGSKKEKKPTNIVADEMAEKIFNTFV